MIVGVLLCLIVLIIIAAIDVPDFALSRFELERREDRGGIELMREKYRSDVVSLQRIFISLLLVGLAIFAVAAWGWLWSSVAAVATALLYGRIACLHPIRRFSTGLYGGFERGILKFVANNPLLLRLIASDTSKPADIRVHSREELVYLLGGATPHVVSEDERRMLLSSLEFGGKTARDIMTPRQRIVSIKRHEILGPLVLDDLHKAGHSHFPVTVGDIDHIVGVLYINDYLTLDTTRKHTLRAESAMNSTVEYVAETEPLESVLETMLTRHQHLLIVKDEAGATSGLLTLKDIVSLLVGRQY